MNNNINDIKVIRAELQNWMIDFSNQMEAKIAPIAKKILTDSIQLQIEGKAKAIEQIQCQKPLSNEQLTSLYRDLMAAIEDLKMNSNGYALYEQIGRINESLNNTTSIINSLIMKVDAIIDNKYIQDNITKEDLWELYDLSGVTQEELAKKFNVSITAVYNILNCKSKKDIRRQNDMRIYLEGIVNNKGAKNANV